jgi:hypothetical protein
VALTFRNRTVMCCDVLFGEWFDCALASVRRGTQGYNTTTKEGRRERGNEGGREGGIGGSGGERLTRFTDPPDFMFAGRFQ